MNTFGLERTHVVSTGRPPITIDQGRQAVIRLREQWPSAEAAICVSDLPEFGAIMECHCQGVAVPGELAIAGFGDFQIARNCWPSITTVRVGCADIGQPAAEFTLRAIDEHERGQPLAPQVEKIAHAVVEREST